MRGAPGPGLDDRALERLLRGTGPGDADLERAVALVRSVATGPAPRPTAALAELLDTGFEPDVVPLRRPTPRRTWAARAGAALTAAAASLVLAGTAQALPPAVQDGLADLVGAVTPFELPRSEAAAPTRTPRPAADRTAASTPTASSPAARTSAAPTTAPTTAPAPAPTSDGPEDEREDAVTEDRTAAERQERDRQRAAEEAAEESAEAAARAADESQDAARDAARASESAARDAARASERAARDAARASQEAAEESAEQAERDAEDADD